MTAIAEFLPKHTRKQLPLPQLPYPLNLIKGIVGEDEDCVLQIALFHGGFKIPHAHDAVVVWLHNEGMAINDIAEQLQLGTVTVRGYLDEAKFRLLKESLLEGEGGVDIVNTDPRPDLFYKESEENEPEALPLPNLPYPLHQIMKIIRKAREEYGETPSSEFEVDCALQIAWKFGGRQIPHAHNVLTVFLWNQDMKIEDIANELRLSEGIVCGYLSQAGLKNAEEFTLEPHILWSIKRKSATTAYLAAFLGGLFGIHRFYLGKKDTALLMLLSGCCVPFFFMIGILGQESTFAGFVFIISIGFLILLVLLVVLARDLIFLNDMVEERNRELAKDIWE